MQLKNIVKWLLATRSISLVINKNKHFDGSIAKVKWKGRTLRYRPGTNDPNIIYNVLFKKSPRVEYYVPEDINPKVILDIGGHIGCAALYFSFKYPNAIIYTFEPVKDNFILLQENILGVENIVAVNVGLGNETRTINVKAVTPSNLASFSIDNVDDYSGPTREIRILNANECLNNLGLKSADLIKLDAEGAESEILSALDKSILASAQWITGELHGNNSIPVLNTLSEWFDLGFRKDYTQRVFMFEGRRK